MIVTDLRDSFNPYPKEKRIENKKVLKDKKCMCEFCGRRGYTEKHHVKTKGSGGDDVAENLIELCRRCHRLVHDGVIKKDVLMKMVKKC